jgi:N-acetylglucosaminyldiphosphoundecaprenol N-acetyl-beta-D-mannosaminyltransferase
MNALDTQIAKPVYPGKRLIDVILASALMLMLLPIVFFAAVFRRKRGERLFIKTSYLGMAKQEHQYWSLNVANAGIAAIPSLLSVVRGHLSFVGPRILTDSEVQQLDTAHPRFAVPPGLVCLWWLRRRSNIDFGNETDADLEYLQTRCLSGDVGIMARALLALAYGAPAQRHSATQVISGIRFLNLSMDELISATVLALDKRLLTSIAFVNPDCVNISTHDVSYRECLASTDWVCADGIGMKIAGRLLGREIRQNINGTDLFPQLCAALEGGKHSIYLLGAQAGVAEQVACWARTRFPGLSIAGTRSGFFDASEEPAVIEAIRASGADVLLVAMGAPLQEKWLHRHLIETGATVGCGVGGLFDFYSGRIPRAPLWLREIGGEWLYRFWQEPGRMWRRYLIGNILFLCRILRERIALGSVRRGRP